MRILHLIDSLAAHGAERSLTTLAPHLAHRGLEYEVATLRSPDTLASSLRESGVTVHDLSGGDGRAAHIARVGALLDAHRPDAIHTTLFRSDVSGRSAAHTRGIPSMTTWASTGPVDGGFIVGMKRRRTTAVDRRTARHAARFHAVSEPVARIVGSRLGVPAERIDVIPRGRDPVALGHRSTERTRHERQRYGFTGPVVVALARHEHVKGLDILIEATALVRRSLPEISVVIAGDSGAATARLHELSRLHRVEDVIRFIRPVDDVGALLAAADLCVAPSRVEGFPGTVVEAMLVGTPLVVADIETIRAAVPHDHMAAFADAGSPVDLARMILGSLADEDAASERASSARQHASMNYTLDSVADRTIAFYERVVDRTAVAR